MITLYLLINFCSIIVPLLFSFHPQIAFHNQFKRLFPALIVTSSIFIVWDILFTKYGIWGFNPRYIVGVYIFNLPIEEYLFFICIPFASVFTHYTLVKMMPDIALSIRATQTINVILVAALLILICFYFDKAYTFYNAIMALITLLFASIYQQEMLRRFYLTFLVVLIPFFIVNGILTGSMIDEPVVWYNNTENLGIRMFTIPVEDTFYAFSMLLMTLILANNFKPKPI
jgi:lycopene cyclase domain-containing protein